MRDPNGRGRCRVCESRPMGGELVGGVCGKCWNQASDRIKARFETESDGELRYSFHGNPRPFHAKKRNSSSRAESTLGNDPALVGREDHDGALPGPASASAPAVAATGAGSSPAPSLEIPGDPLPWTRERAQRLSVMYWNLGDGLIGSSRS